MNFDNQPFIKIKENNEIKEVDSISFKDGVIFKINSNNVEYDLKDVSIIYKDNTILKEVDNEYIEKSNELLHKKYENLSFSFFDGFYVKGIVLKDEKGAFLAKAENINDIIESLENLGLRVLKYYSNNLSSFYICLQNK